MYEYVKQLGDVVHKTVGYRAVCGWLFKDKLKGLFPKSTKSKKFKNYVIDGATCHDLALLFALKISYQNIPYPVEIKG
jgi:hypothetical protein